VYVGGFRVGVVRVVADDLKLSASQVDYGMPTAFASAMEPLTLRSRRPQSGLPQEQQLPSAER